MSEANDYADFMGEGRYDEHQYEPEPEDSPFVDEAREEDAAADALQDARRRTQRADELADYLAEPNDGQTVNRFYHLDEVVDPAAIAYASLLQDISTINATVSRCSDRAELWQLLAVARDIEHRAAKLVNAVFDRIGRILTAADDDDTTESPF